MKKSIPLFVLSAGIVSASVAQPVLTSSSIFPSVGTTDTVYTATATVAPGASGAAVTWNFSALSFSRVAVLTWVNPSSSPYISTFPSSNLAFSLTTSGTAYNYMRSFSTGMETIATTYAGTGTGTDYSINPRLAAPFPFHYTDAVVDTYQASTGGPQVETLTYDGYGTLVTSMYTYYNVIRVKEDYGGSDYHYAWYTTNPLQLVMDYSNTGNNYGFIAATPPPTAVDELSSSSSGAQIFPNPSSGNMTLLLRAPNSLRNARLMITDAMGRVVKQVSVCNASTTITHDGLHPGIYFYQVFNDGALLSAGKIAIE